MDAFPRFLTMVIDRFYIKPVRRVMPLQTFRYAACGALNMVVGWLLFYAFNHWVIAGRYIDLGFIVVAPYTAALYSTVPFTFALGFYFNRSVAFTRSPLRTHTQFIRYIFSWAVSIFLNHWLLKLFVEGFGFWNTPAQMLATLVITFAFSYPMQKYYTFRGCEQA